MSDSLESGSISAGYPAIQYITLFHRIPIFWSWRSLRHLHFRAFRRLVSPWITAFESMDFFGRCDAHVGVRSIALHPFFFGSVISRLSPDSATIRISFGPVFSSIVVFVEGLYLSHSRRHSWMLTRHVALEKSRGIRVLPSLGPPDPCCDARNILIDSEAGQWL